MFNGKGLVFVVEAETFTAQLAQRVLEQMDYEVRVFHSADMIEEVRQQRPSLMLVASSMPDGSGIGLCRQVRENALVTKTPMVLLVATEEENVEAASSESGADNYLRKPFTPGQLVTCLHAALPEKLAKPMLMPESADIVIDKAAMRLSVRGADVAITALEFRLIDYIARHRGQVFTRDVLLDAVWGEMQFVSPRSVDACIRRLREKIEPEKGHPKYLKTIRGIGYRFDAAAAWPNPSDDCECIACTSVPGPSEMARVKALRRRRSA